MIRPSTLIKHSPGSTPGHDGWQKAAACIDTDPELFFIDGKPEMWEHDSHADQRDEAKAVCASCPEKAKVACLADAYAAGDKDSIRGGLTPVERERLRLNGKRKSRAKLDPDGPARLAEATREANRNRPNQREKSA